MRSGKGKSLLFFPDTYCIVDIETTGLDFGCKIIEISALKIESDKIVNSFSKLVNPGPSTSLKIVDGTLIPYTYYIPSFVQELTGITDSMVECQPLLDEILPSFSDFICDNTLIGHNIVSFDSNFLYDAFLSILGKELSNDLVDTMRLSRWLLPNLQHHRLCDIMEYFNIIPELSHRGLPDCENTYNVFNALKDICVKEHGTLEAFYNYVKSRSKKSRYSIKASDIKATKTDFDVSNPIYGSVCVFTGTLEKMTRREAMQIVKNLGGDCKDNVTKNTNYLILGNNDFCKSIKDGKSNKQKKAENLQLEGNDIQVISESVFYEMISD